jgi:ribosomal protein S18 acetylase RimI-like enzyme
MPKITVERVHGPARRAIIRGLVAYNNTAIGRFDFKRLSVTVRDRGEIVGGLSAETYLGWMFIALLWVDEKFRGRGFGSKLMRAAEKAARQRGVKHVYVDTFSFQAPAFYRKLGYRQFGKLNNFPAGHSRCWLTKAL